MDINNDSEKKTDSSTAFSGKGDTVDLFEIAALAHALSNETSSNAAEAAQTAEAADAAGNGNAGMTELFELAAETAEDTCYSVPEDTFPIVSAEMESADYPSGFDRADFSINEAFDHDDFSTDEVFDHDGFFQDDEEDFSTDDEDDDFSPDDDEENDSDEYDEEDDSEYDAEDDSEYDEKNDSEYDEEDDSDEDDEDDDPEDDEDDAPEDDEDDDPEDDEEENNSEYDEEENNSEYDEEENNSEYDEEENNSEYDEEENNSEYDDNEDPEDENPEDGDEYDTIYSGYSDEYERIYGKTDGYRDLPDHYIDYPDEAEYDESTGYDEEDYSSDGSEYKEEASAESGNGEEADETVDDAEEENGSAIQTYDAEIGKAEWLRDEDGAPLPNDSFSENDGAETPEAEDDEVNLFAVASNADYLPPTDTHGALYYWAKKKTAAGWVKFGLKCVAAVLLIAIVSVALYFNGLLNLIDYKAADDFEIYDNISDTDYDEEDIVYSSPESYIETTTIEGFNESMIDIPKKDVLNILLIGTDVRGGTYEDRGNTDSMILISVNTRDKTIKLTSLMRDMYVYIPNRQWARLNVAYAYGGPQLLFDTIKANFDIDLDLYVRVNFANFRKIINHVGGVDIELSEAEAAYMNRNAEKYKTKPVEPGMQHLDGSQALSYARCRKIDSDFNRTRRQRTVIIALVDRIKHSSPGELNSLLNVFLPMIQTNMSKMQILGLMVDGTTYLNNEIETLNVPIKNSWRSETINKRSVICPNFELNKTAMTAHIYSTYHLDVEKTRYQSFSVPKS